MSETPWIVIRSPYVLLCQRCGGLHEMPLPQPLWVAAALTKGFQDEHRDCEPSKTPEQETERRFESLQAWRHGHDTGNSSLAIYHAILGGASPDFSWGPPIPYDPSDFGRCLRLVRGFPELRPQLHKVAEAWPGSWPPFVDAWDELEALWDEEEPSGNAPKLYARLQELRVEEE